MPALLEPASTPGGGERLGHRAALDGLRGIAIAVVLLHHVSMFVDDRLHLSGAFVGVELFFVLSGFVITRLLLEELRSTGRIAVVAFYRRRARRLLPPLLVMLTVVVGIAVLTDRTTELMRHALAALLYVANLTYPAAPDRGGALGHLWSLSVEEQFYLAWPLLLSFGWRHGGGTVARRATIAATLVLAGVTAVRAALGAGPVALYYGTFAQGGVLLLGGASLAMTLRLPVRLPPRVLDLVAFAAVVVFAVVSCATDWSSTVHSGTGFGVILLASLALVIAALANDTAVSRLGRTRPLCRLGRISYAVYLWHLPILYLCQPLHAVMPLVGVDATIVLLSLSAGEVSRRWVEAPANRRYVAPIPPRPVVFA